MRTDWLCMAVEWSIDRTGTSILPAAGFSRLLVFSCRTLGPLQGGQNDDQLTTVSLRLQSSKEISRYVSRLKLEIKELHKTISSQSERNAFDTFTDSLSKGSLQTHPHQHSSRKWMASAPARHTRRYYTQKKRSEARTRDALVNPTIDAIVVGEKMDAAPEEMTRSIQSSEQPVTQ